MEHYSTMSKSAILIFLAMMCHHMCISAEEMRYSEDQIAMESASDSSQYRSYLPPPSDFKFTPNLDDQIEDLPTPEKWKSSSELRKSTARTFKDGKPVVLIDHETGLPVDPEEKKKYLANPEEHQARNSYSYVNTNSGTLLFGTGNPYYYLNFTDSQQNTFAALGNAALFLGSLLVLGNLPAGTLGLGRNDEEQNFVHRTGSLGRPPHDVLLPPPRLPAPANPISNGINRFKKGIKRIVGRNNRRPTNQRQGTFRSKSPKYLGIPNLAPSTINLQHLNPVAGVRRLRKKVGNALKGVSEYTYRKRGSGRNTLYRGDRRGQNIESSNSIPSRHPHHRNYPLPLPPTQAVVTNSLRNRNRYNRKKEPVYFDDLPEYGNDIYETGVVLEPIRPPLDGHPVYYDEEEYVFQDYNDIPLVPPTPEPTLRRQENRQKTRPRLSDTFRNYRNDIRDYDDMSYPTRNRQSGYPLALSSTATTTTNRPYNDINEISSEHLSSVDSLDLNLNPYMKAPEQQYNAYPTLTKDSPSDSIPNTYGASSENDLLSGTENNNKKKTNKRRKINKSKRRKIKRRPQKQRVIQEEAPIRSSYTDSTQDPIETLEKLKQERISSQGSRGSFMPSYDNGANGDRNGPTLNNPFGGSNSFPTPTASWTQLSPSSNEKTYDDRRYSNDERRYSNNDAADKQGSGYNPFEPTNYDPFEQMAKDFDGGNDEWISTISQAFEGFSDFKKIDGGQETDLK